MRNLHSKQQDHFALASGDYNDGRTGKSLITCSRQSGQSQREDFSRRSASGRPTRDPISKGLQYLSLRRVHGGAGTVWSLDIAELSLIRRNG